MNLLVFATELEAQPFIDHHRLRCLEEQYPCTAYEGEGLLLIISGMGFLKGAVAKDFAVFRKTGKNLTLDVSSFNPFPSRDRAIAAR